MLEIPTPTPPQGMAARFGSLASAGDDTTTLVMSGLEAAFTKGIEDFSVAAVRCEVFRGGVGGTCDFLVLAVGKGVAKAAGA